MIVRLHVAEFPLASTTVYVTVWLPILSSNGDPDGSVVVVSGVLELSLVVALGTMTDVSGRPSSVSRLKSAGQIISGSSASGTNHV